MNDSFEIGSFGTFVFTLNGKRPDYTWGDKWTIEGCTVIDIRCDRVFLRDAEGIEYKPKISDIKSFKATKR